jgi:hypothetical protein
MLVADGGFHENGAFKVVPVPDGKQIAALFRNKVLKMLLAKGKITPERIALMNNWQLGVHLVEGQLLAGQELFGLVFKTCHMLPFLALGDGAYLAEAWFLLAAGGLQMPPMLRFHGLLAREIPNRRLASTMPWTEDAPTVLP